VVRDRSGRDSINVLGYCMGGTMSVMYSALHPDKVRNLGLMAAGLCFAGDGGVLELWGDEEYYDPEKVTETFDNVPAEFLDIGFALMDPVANGVTKYVRLYENIEDEDFVENFARMEEWLGDGIDVAGETYVQFLRDVYQKNSLYENELELDGKHVDIGNLEMPILQIVAEYDHLIPPGASTPFNDVVPSDDVTTMEFPTGHIGMSVSSSSHAELWPDVCEWFEERSDVDEPAAEATADPESPDAALAEDGDPDDPDAQAAATDGPDVTDERDLEEIDGIGPSYADRLRSAGIESVADLAAASAADVADDADVPVSSLEGWIEQSQSAAER